MRRTLCLLFALLLCLSLVPAALATQATEPVELEDFTYESARAVIADRGWEGIACRIDGAERKLWLPAGVERIPLTEEAEQIGMLAYFAASDFVLVVSYADYGGITLEEYLQNFVEAGCKNTRLEEVNGMQTAIYDEPKKDGSLCRVAAMAEPDGRFLEFVFFVEDERLYEAADVVIASIREEK